MSKVYLIAILIILSAFNAKAQWWKLWPRRQFVLPQTVFIDHFEWVDKSEPSPTQLVQLVLPPTAYDVDLTEVVLIKTLQHSLRFHITAEIIIGFNNLVDFYLAQKKYSEAKWYLLRCNDFARQKNDVINVIATLYALGKLKMLNGELAQAKSDLVEAFGLARQYGKIFEALEIEKKLNALQIKINLNAKSEYQLNGTTDVTKS